ncbi:MAG TPA: hypothetical protein VH637_19670 [Streptosporangiaceae bacterium]|jgi:hypothetical protein
MTTVALISWLAAASFGLFMFAIWLIEYGGNGESRLPAAVVFGHVLLAVAGLAIWIVYLIAADDRLADAALVILLAVAALGLTMLRRWLSVYRESTVTLTVGAAEQPGSAPALRATPAESNFPVAVVVGHGLFAVLTVVLVLLTVFGLG